MERYVECESRGLTLRGMLHVPDQRPGKVPFVILFHGFCDDRNEINFVHTELSRRLCERGIASVRFDFAGSGDSDGRFEDMTVSSEVEDGLAILDYVKSLDFVDQSRIAIHGGMCGLHGGGPAGCGRVRPEPVVPGAGRGLQHEAQDALRRGCV